MDYIRDSDYNFTYFTRNVRVTQVKSECASSDNAVTQVSLGPHAVPSLTDELSNRAVDFRLNIEITPLRLITHES